MSRHGFPSGPIGTRSDFSSTSALDLNPAVETRSMGREVSPAKLSHYDWLRMHACRAAEAEAEAEAERFMVFLTELRSSHIVFLFSYFQCQYLSIYILTVILHRINFMKKRKSRTLVSVLLVCALQRTAFRWQPCATSIPACQHCCCCCGCCGCCGCCVDRHCWRQTQETRWAARHA